MPLLDFMHGHRSVAIGGRVFRVGRPTVETVFRLLRLFPNEIDACRVAFKGKEFDPEVALPVFVREPEKFGSVLETCVQGDGYPSSWPLAELAKAALDECDVERVVSAFRGSEPDPDTVPPDIADDNLEDVAFCQIATFYSVSPMELAKWPFEAYLSARDAAGRIIRGDTQPKKWFMGAPTGEPGVTVM